MMDRYRLVDVHNEDEQWSDMKKHKLGDWIKYEDYLKERASNFTSAQLCDVVSLFPSKEEIEYESQKYSNELSSIAESVYVPEGFIKGAEWAKKYIGDKGNSNFR